MCCHPSGLSSVAPGRLARTAWDSAHFPALIIPACSAGTGPLPLGPPLPPPLPLLASPLSSGICYPFSQSNYCTPPFLPDFSLSYYTQNKSACFMYCICLQCDYCICEYIHKCTESLSLCRPRLQKRRSFTRQDETFIKCALSSSLGFPDCLTAIAISS